MKKSIYVVALAALMIGVTGCGAVGSLMSKGEKEVSEYYKDRYGETKKFEIEFDGFEDVDVEMPIGDVKLEEGDSYSLRCMFPEKLMPDYKIGDGTLKVTGKDSRGLYGDLESRWSVTITVPKDADLNEVTIDCKMGNITVNGVSGKKLDIDTEMGDIIANNDISEHAVLSCSMGDTNISYVTFDTLDGVSKMGHVRVNYSTIADVNWNGSMGDVDLLGNFGKIRVSDSMGSIYVNCENDWKGTLCTSMGDVSVNGQSKGESYEQ